MKIRCPCGAVIADITDNLSYKAHFVADQDRGDYWDAIEAAVLQPAASVEERQSTFSRVRRLISSLYRPGWVCRDCGRLFIYDQRDQLQQFVPATVGSADNLFRSRSAGSTGVAEPGAAADRGGISGS